MSSILIALIVLSIMIVWLGVSILKRCDKILSAVERLQQRFMSNEFLSMKKLEKLAPLFFMPLADIAGEIKRMDDDTKEAFDKTLKDLQAIEVKEMEDFAATNPPDGKAFIPSDNLKEALKAWSIESYKAEVIYEWTNLLKDVYLDLLTAKITIKEAEEKLDCVSSLRLHLDVEVDHKFEEIFNREASRWEAEKWRNHLDYLRKVNQKEYFEGD